MEVDSEANPIEISPKRVCCPGHGEHFRANWPVGFATFSVHAFQKATENPKLWDACRKAANLSPDEQIPPTAINLVTEKQPLCYFLERSDILEMLQEAGTLPDAAWLKIDRCDICGIPRLAGSYDVKDSDQVNTLTVCLECACDAGERYHQAYPDGGVWSSDVGEL